MRTVVHVFVTPFRHESRALRAIEAACEAGLADSVLVEAMAEADLPAFEAIDGHAVIWRVPVRTRGWPRRPPAQVVKYLEWASRCVLAMRGRRMDLIHAHSLPALLPAVGIKMITKAPLVYDAHELETETQGMAGLRKQAARSLERSLLYFCDEVLVVSDHIADFYAKAYGIPRPTVLRNIPARPARSHAAVNLKERLGLPSHHLLFLHLGNIDAGRGVERLIRIFERTRPGRDLVFLGSGGLESTVTQAARRGRCIHHLPAVRPDQVLSHAAGADVGILLFPRTCLNHYYSLPNKIFEYFSAGLPAIVADLPEQAAIVRAHDCGWVVSGDDDCARLIDRLESHDVKAKTAAARRARAELTWDREKEKLLLAYRRALRMETAASGSHTEHAATGIAEAVQGWWPVIHLPSTGNYVRRLRP